MKKSIAGVFLTVFVGGLLALGGCSDFDEMHSKRLLNQAETLLEQGQQAQAEQVLADVLARYPDTPSATAADQQLQRLRKQRELQEREVFAKLLDSYQQVFSGYHALHAEYPRSLEVLDQSDYFFDSAYLEEITPDGYLVYLWFAGDGSGYRLWCVAENRERGYAIEALSRKLVPFERQEIEGKIKDRFQAVTRTAKLVALQTHN